MPEPGPEIELGPLRLDRSGRTLTRDGIPILISGRAVEVLAVLADAEGQTVSKDVLFDKVWAGQIVEENNIQVQISALRKALGDGWIMTVPGRGYRLSIPTVIPGTAPADIAVGKPTIAILPFVNISADPEQEFFADGMAEDITTALSRVRSFFVIARNSSFSYKNRATDVRQVGRDLGVRYVLEGSVRKSGERLRVSAQLSDAEGGSQIWAERYDRELAEIFTLQDEITEAVARAIEPAISAAEQQRAAQKPPGNLSAWESYQRGLWHFARPTAEDRSRATEFFNRAVASDPTFAPPYYLLAALQFVSTASYLGRTTAEAAAVAEPLAFRAIELDPHDADAHAIATIAGAWHGKWDGALARAEQAIGMNPNSVLAHRARAFCLYNAKRRKEARTELMTCLRLNSRDPHNWLIQLQLAITYYLDADYGSALSVLESAVRLYPSEPQILMVLVSTLGQVGRSSEGLEVLNRARSLLPPGGNLANPFRAPFRFSEDHEHLLDGLRKSGWKG